LLFVQIGSNVDVGSAETIEKLGIVYEAILEDNVTPYVDIARL